MNGSIEQSTDEDKTRISIILALRIGFVALLLVMSYLILKPFIAPVLWGIIIAVAIFPLHKRFSGILGNREKLSAVLIVLAGLALIIVPAVMFTSSTIDSVQSISQKLENGSISLPPLDEKVADWPVIGKTIYDTWTLAAKSLKAAVLAFRPQIMEFTPKVLSAIAGLGGTILLFIISIIISGAFLMSSKSAEKAAHIVFRTLAGKQGEQFATLAGATIRSVVQGVLGTAVIQTLFLSLGLYIIGFPAAGLVSLIVLFFAIIQLPLILVLIPVIIYVFSYAGTTAAVIFMVWSLVWGAADTFIKPMLMGRGVDIPMLVILLGAIGGMMLGGIIGLFIGAVLLAFTYKMFEAIVESV